MYAQVKQIGNAPGETFARFAERVLRTLAARAASTLILDLRPKTEAVTGASTGTWCGP